ncbi:MAG: GAF domain-containing protein [Defluviitaleaceae bacterium]|nr:GAF domain-containing protein [Defluviitaleaceae bacterium]
MFEHRQAVSGREGYDIMLSVVSDMLADENDVCANLANIGAVINMYMDRLNWVGFYIMKDGELVLGPFQGKPACVRIKVGSGVCGTAAARREVVVVDDVHQFEGHIACDSASNSEIVLPVYQHGQVYGVLDIDSPEFSRFGELEQEVLTKLADKISSFLRK